MYVLKLYIHLSCNFKIPALVATNMAADVLTSHEKHETKTAENCPRSSEKSSAVIQMLKLNSGNLWI